MASGPNPHANLAEAERLIDEAAQRGAQLVVLPENFAVMGLTEQDKVGLREAPGDGPIQRFLAERSAAHGIWLVGGTIPLVSSDPGKVLAAALVFDPRGNQVGRYDKIHLFDVELAEAGGRYNESETIEPGESDLVLETPFGQLGVAVCYDLRFPELFRSMLDRGMQLMAVPSAFTSFTGRAHWESLVRARAIENLSYVIAAAQGGFHVNGRETFGHTMIVDPWGVILAQQAQGRGVVTAEVDLERLAATRTRFPAISHRRYRCTQSN